jgi:hypothetical protein
VRAIDLLPNKDSLGVLLSQGKAFLPKLDIWSLRCDTACMDIRGGHDCEALRRVAGAWVGQVAPCSTAGRF